MIFIYIMFGSLVLSLTLLAYFVISNFFEDRKFTKAYMAGRIGIRKYDRKAGFR